MTKQGPWSVKGIDHRAREAAREAAREEGLTIGEYINRMLLEEDDSSSMSQYRHGRYTNAMEDMPQASRARSGGAFDQLIERLEAVEARSTLALTGIDQSIVGLVSRLNKTDVKSDRVAGNVEALMDDLRDTREKLQSKMRALEEDESGHRNLESLRSLEQAVSQLSQRMYDENSRHRDDTASVRKKVESDLEDMGARVEGIEGRVDARLSEMEKFSERVNAVEDDVAGALSSIEAVMNRMHERLHAAESSTNAALEGLEKTFHRLDERIDAIAEAASPEAAAKLRAQFEDRFEGLTAELRHSIESSRVELAREIEEAVQAAPEALEGLEKSVAGLQQRMSANEARSGQALENMTGQVRKISSALDRRLREVEARDPGEAVEGVRNDMQRLSQDVSQRFDSFSAQSDEVIDKVTAQMNAMADEFDSRVGESERRSADAIEQVGEQVANVAQRLQARQERAFTEIRDEVDQARKQQNMRLSDALSGVSERLDKMHQKQEDSLSPVQKAISSLATRLEAVEDFTVPPHAETEPYDAPEFAAPALDHFGDVTASAEMLDKDEQGKPDDRPPAYLVEGDEASDESLFAPGFEEFASDEEALEADEEFQAGVPDLAELEEEFKLEDTPAAGDEAVSDEFELASVSEDEVPEYETELMGLSDTEIGDPLSELSGWDDGREETRESDIFGEDGDSPAKDEFVAPEWVDDSVGHDVQDFMGETDNTEELSSSSEEAPDDQDGVEAMDYLSRARRAALAATNDTGARHVYEAQGGRRSKVPLVAAVSIMALAAAAAGTFVTLRGFQGDPGRASLQTGTTNSSGPGSALAAKGELTSVASLAMAVPTEEMQQDGSLSDDDAVLAEPADIEPLQPEELAGLSESEVAEVEEELFDEESPDGAAESEAPADTGQTTEVDFVSLPTVPEKPTLEESAASGNSVAQLLLGEQKIDEGDYTNGPSLVRKAAEGGEPAAQYRLAKLHERGLGVPKDLEAARDWTQRAAEGGNVKAMHDLAVYFAEGEGGQKSYAAAVEWFRKAAGYGLTDSQYNLAVLYESGLGITQSQTEALYWYEIAHMQGDDGAMGRIEELRDSLSTDAVQQVESRVASWAASQRPLSPNGNFSKQPWQDGGSNEQVAAIQTVLGALGYQAGPADGILGEGTISAIQAYQYDTGLQPTGEITPALVKSLNQTVDVTVRTG
ncbi:peptidoglycan-binding protein [Henriciella sp.]|uniref:peptidoglycan-binding protein n=1 Tax=Henriciella sp. TaxID=1968823 RepID=UPI00260214B2|nr:peptidoglycan-binding protein [Henriciella sp.]